MHLVREEYFEIRQFLAVGGQQPGFEVRLEALQAPDVAGTPAQIHTNTTGTPAQIHINTTGAQIRQILTEIRLST